MEVAAELTLFGHFAFHRGVSALPWLLTDIVFHGADERQVSILVIEVQAVTDDKAVGDLEATVVRFDGQLLPAGLAKQNGDLERRRLQLTNVLDQVAQRLAGVENVVEQQDMTAAKVGQQLRADFQPARLGGCPPIAGRLDQADADRQVEPADEVRQEHQAPGQHANDRDRLLLVVGANLPGQFGHALLNLLAGNKDLHGRITSHAPQRRSCAATAVQYQTG